jgi:hypothetical protein
MNRWIFEPTGLKSNLIHGETSQANQDGIRIDDGDKKVIWTTTRGSVFIEKHFFENFEKNSIPSEDWTIALVVKNNMVVAPRPSFVTH